MTGILQATKTRTRMLRANERGSRQDLLANRNVRWLTLGLLNVAMVGLFGIPCQPAQAEHNHAYCRYFQAKRAAAGASSSGSLQFAPDRIVDVIHIKLEITPDFETRTIEGVATLRVAPIGQPLRELRLDAVNLNVRDVRSRRQIEDYTVTPDSLRITFRDEIPVGEEVGLTIEYDAEPKKGLYFRTDDMGYPAGDQQLWTQGEPHEARHWFPCFDYPNERSSTEVLCCVPRGMTVLSNGRLVKDSVDKSSNTRTTHWLQEKPHANYLICLVAGYLDRLESQHRDVPLTFYSQPSKSNYAKNSFRDTADIMAFFEKEIGVPFPWDKYAQVTIMDFMWGGMENTSLTTLTDGTLFSEETEGLNSSRGLNAHEMAHQWFGDYVTCKDWSHLWLNEGFATYYEALHNGHQNGRDAFLYEMYRNRQSVLEQGSRDLRPIVYKGYQSPKEQFDFRAYPKGAWVLHMLRNQLGEEVYRNAVQTYLERHALSSVVTEELNSVMEEVSGKSLDRFFDQWVYHGRHPDIRVSYHWSPLDRVAKITVRQTQEVHEAVRLFEFPTRLRFKIGGEVVDKQIVVSKASQEFYVALPGKPQIVRFDPELTILADIRFAKSRPMLYAQLRDGSDAIGRLMAAEQLGKLGSAQAVTALKVALQNDPLEGVRETAASALREIGTDPAFEALVDSADQPNAATRKAVIEQIAKFYRTDARDTLMVCRKSEKNPAILGSIVKGLGSYSGDDIRDSILEALRHKSFGNLTVNAAMDAIAAQASGDYVNPLLEALDSRADELTARQLAHGMAVLSQLPVADDQQQDVVDLLLRYMDHPQTQLQNSAIRALGKFDLPDARRTLAALRSNPDKQVAKIATEAYHSGPKPAAPELKTLNRNLSKLREEQEAMQKHLERLTEKLKAYRSEASGDNEGPSTEEQGTEEQGTEEQGTEEQGTEEQGTEEQGREEPENEGPKEDAAREQSKETEAGDTISDIPKHQSGQHPTHPPTRVFLPEKDLPT